MFRAYIKDCLNINGDTKTLLDCTGGEIKQDRMLTANSTINFYEMDTSVSIGDYLFLLNDNGKELYKGVISSIKDKKITTKQYYDVFNGTFIYSIVDYLKQTSPSTYLEEEIGKVLEHFMQGKLYGSSYTDTLIAQKLSPITIQTINEITTLLESDLSDDGKEKWTQKDVVKWLYDLYDKYDIVLDLSVPLQAGSSVAKIWKPNYSGLKITDGFECINSITPTTETQKQNKLVVYWNSEVDGEHQAKEYRGTYILTSNGIIQEPTSIAGRMNQVNTKIVFSDDPIEDVIASNLNDTLFNHKIDFNVNLTSKLFTFDDLKLDVPLEIYNGLEYYNTKITAKEFSFDENGVISDIKITGGKIRNSLTSKIQLGLIRGIWYVRWKQIFAIWFS